MHKPCYAFPCADTTVEYTWRLINEMSNVVANDAGISITRMSLMVL
jgi:hypothetical protein